MSEGALKRIEKMLGRLAEQQEQICERIENLEAQVSSRAGGKRPSRDDVLAFLDQFRAGEALGAKSTQAWIEVSDMDCVRGGLRTVAQREGMHAQLLEERLRALGGKPTVEIPAADVERAMKQAGSTEKTDAQKLLEFVQNFSDIDGALKPIHDLADQLDDDPETQYLLRTIAQDERSTLEFLHQACQLLNG